MEDVQMANGHMTRCLALLVIREVQIEAAVMCCLAPSRVAIIKESTGNRCSRVWRRGSYAVGGNMDWCSHSG